MLLRVELPEGAWLADVGFGGDGLVHPLAFDGGELWIGPFGHRLRREDELWVLQSSVRGSWGDLYAFSLEPQYPVDFVMASHFTSTWPDSPFLNTLTAQRCWPERRAILRNRDLVVRETGGETRETVRDPEHLLEILEGVFGLSFPPGTRFPKLEW
jgi:N-hydroxyarylamine O-acetyltransferase